MTSCGIVIIGTGLVGAGVARLCCKYGIPIVGAVNRPGPKVGKTLAELYGIESLANITVQSSLKDALATAQADIAIVSTGDRLAENLGTYLECLSAGLNIITSASEATYPAAVSNEIADTLHRTALKNEVTFLGTAFQDCYRIWLPRAVAGASSRLTKIKHHAVIDVGRHGIASAKLAGVGLHPDKFDSHVTGGDPNFIPLYRLFLVHLAFALNSAPKHASHAIEPILNETQRNWIYGDISIPTGFTIGACFRSSVITVNNFELSAVNELRLVAPGEEEFLEWDFVGDAPAKLRLSGLDSEAATVTQIVNRIPDVLIAPSGVVTVDSIGCMRPYANRAA